MAQKGLPRPGQARAANSAGAGWRMESGPTSRYVKSTIIVLIIIIRRVTMITCINSILNNAVIISKIMFLAIRNLAIVLCILAGVPFLANTILVMLVLVLCIRLTLSLLFVFLLPLIIFHFCFVLIFLHLFLGGYCYNQC